MFLISEDSPSVSMPHFGKRCIFFIELSLWSGMMDQISHAMTILRERMVEEQLVRRGIHDAGVLHAMRVVPREEFVASEYRLVAYDDCPLPIEEGQTISQPYIVALMAQLLMLSPGNRILDVGTGSGYAAAVLSRIAAEVYTIESLPELARSAAERLRRLEYNNIYVSTGNGALGWSEYAPYDGIIFSAGAPRIPEALRAQLSIGARLVGPVGKSPYFQDLLCVQRLDERRYSSEKWGEVRFVPLVGEGGWGNGGSKESFLA